MIRARVSIGLVLILVVLGAAWVIATPQKSYASTGINQELSFEGKIVNASGINVPDGTYNMEFKIYSGGTPTGGGTLEWTEDYLVGGTGAGITFSSGTFQTNLGSVCSLSGGSCETYTNTAINWNTFPLYLSLQIGNTSACTVTTNFNANCGGDGEMSPYILLTSTPYAFNSAELGGLSASSYVQTAPTTAQTIQPTTNVVGLTVLQNSAGSPTADIFDVGTANSTAVLQVQAPSANTSNVLINAVGAANNVTINPAGTGTLNLGTVASANTIQIGSTTLASGTQTINIGNDNTAGGTTNLIIGDGSSAAGGTTLIQGKTSVTETAGNASQLINTSGDTISNTAGSATAFQVQNVAGLNVLDVNTTLSGLNANALNWPGTNTLTTLLPPLVPTSATFSGTAGTTGYSYEVVAVSANGSSSIASPAKATANTANALLSGTNTVALAWTAVTNATSYQIYRTTFAGTTPTGNSDTFGLIGTSTTNSFTDVGNPASGVTPTNTGSLAATGYWFKVVAIDSAGGQSLSSPETAAATTPGSANLAINVSWAPITGARGYQVYYGTSSGGETNGYFTTYTNNYNFSATTGTTAGAIPTVATGYSDLLGATSVGQITLATAGNDVEASEQLYVAGNTPSAAVGSLSTTTGSVGEVYQGNFIYLINSTSLEVIDNSSPSSPTLVSTTTTTTTPTAIYVSGIYAYITNSGGASGANLQIFNIANPAAPVSIGTVQTLSTAAAPSGISVIGAYAYVVDGSATAISNVLQVIKISNPASPVVVGSVTIGTGTGSQGVHVSENYAYIANKTTSTMAIVNISVATAPVLVSTITTGTAPVSIAVTGNYAYEVNTTTGTFQVFNVSNTFTPALVGSLTMAAGLSSVYVSASDAYVTNSTTGFLYTIDVTNPSDPILVGSSPTTASVGLNSVIVEGNYAYATNSTTSTLQVYDLGGGYVQQLTTGGIETDSLQINKNANVVGNQSIGGGLNVSGDTQVGGDLGVGGNLFLTGSVALGGGTTGGFITNSLGTPTTPTITFTGTTGVATTYTYEIVAIASNGGTTAGSPGGTISAADTTFANMSAVNYNTITWTPIAGAIGYNVYRTVGGTTQGKINTTTVTASFFKDTGLAATTAAPTVDTTNAITSNALQSAAATALSLTGNAASTWSTTAGAITIQSGTGNIILQPDGTGATANIQIGAGDGGTGSTTPDLLVLDDNSSASDPTEVNGAMYYNASIGTFRCGVDTIWQNCGGLLSSNVSPSSADNTCTAACNAFSLLQSIPANYCQPGRVINILAYGVYSTAASITISLGVYMGTNTTTKTSDTLLGAVSGALSSGAARTNQGFRLQFSIVCDTIGAPGTVNGQGVFTLDTTSAASILGGMFNNGATSVTNNAATDILIFPTFSASAAGDTMTIQQLIVTAQ